MKMRGAVLFFLPRGYRKTCGLRDNPGFDILLIYQNKLTFLKDYSIVDAINTERLCQYDYP